MVSINKPDKIEKPDIIEKIRKRSKAARMFANISVVCIVVLVWVMIFFFYVGPAKIIQVGDISGTTGDVMIGPGESSAWSEIGPIIGKLTTIFLALFLIQILVGFTRYQYRIADHLEAIAFALELSNKDPEILEKVMLVLNPSHIEFGKMPAAVSDKSLDVLKDAISKISPK